MGKVDHIEGTEEKVETNRDQGVGAPQKQSVDHLLNDL
jgi:hypothetical protein